MMRVVVGHIWEYTTKTSRVVCPHHQHLNHQGKENMRIERNVNGAVLISDIIDGHLVAVQYFYYTEEQAKELFKREYKKEQD